MKYTDLSQAEEWIPTGSSYSFAAVPMFEGKYWRFSCGSKVSTLTLNIPGSSNYIKLKGAYVVTSDEDCFTLLRVLKKDTPEFMMQMLDDYSTTGYIRGRESMRTDINKLLGLIKGTVC